MKKRNGEAAGAASGQPTRMARFGKYMGKHWHGYVFIAPVMLGILFFTLVPMLQSLYYSFFRYYNVVKPPSGFGLFNFRRMMLDPDFWQALKVTGIYTVISIPVMMVLSFLLALLLNRNFKGIGVFRVLIYLPVVIPVTVSGIIWRNFTEVDFGLANAFLEALGLPRFTFFDAADTSMFSLIFFNLWGLGGGMILWLSALKNVPPALYEAAEIDGAGRMRKLVSITIPQSGPLFLYNMITLTIATVQFNGTIAFAPNTGAGNNDATLMLGVKVYIEAFRRTNIGYASALSWVLMIITAAITLIMFKVDKRLNDGNY